MIQLTRDGKYSLYINSPVMPAAGVMGFANAYSKLIHTEKLGAYISNPITYEAWSPASGTRVIPMDAGVLIHSGLPNNGLNATLSEYAQIWAAMPIPVIVHFVATNEEQIRRGIEKIDRTDSIAAVELGLDDDISWEGAARLVKAATERAEKPVLVRLPLNDAYEIAPAVADVGAGALVVAAPPRGTARDPRSGRLVSGRIYGPVVKPLTLRVLGVLARRIKDVPLIGAGGIHSPQDARDYLEAGATAVQVDSVTWIKPRMLERIARDLSGGLVTRAADAFPDEWHPDMGDTEFRALFGDNNEDTAGKKK
jgi:dihydroorotate dehydrogenase